MYDHLRYLLLLTILIQLAKSTGIAFQGSCADRSVLCEQLCIALSSDTYECWCWDGHVLLGDGIGCIANDSKIEVYFSDNQDSQSTWVSLCQSPMCFMGQTFMQFPAPENSYLETNITIEFRIVDYEDGILLYAGEYEGNDFIAIAFIDKSIVLRFDCGEGTVEESYRGKFEKDTWHIINVKRKFCEHSELKIDHGNTVIDEIRELNNYKGVTIETGICIGGAPARVRNLSSRVTAEKGFRGCVRQVIVNNVTLYDAHSGINRAVTANNFCDEKLWKNGTITTRNFSKHLNVTMATISSIPVVPSYVDSICAFDEASYVQVRAPDDDKTYLELSFLIKPQQPNGLVHLLPSKQQYFSIYFENGFLMVQYTLADGYEVLSSRNPLSLNIWHHVEVWRSGKASLLKIDNQPWIESRISNVVPIDEDENNGIAYFGGAPTAQIPPSLPVRTGLSGCLKMVYQNGQLVDLIQDALTIHKVYRCGWNVCDTIQCKGQVPCIAYRAEPYCRCSFPSFGSFCEKKYLSPITEMRFERFSYLKLSHQHVMKHVAGENLDLSLMIMLRNVTDEFNLNRPDQILAYTGDSDSLVGDYLHLILSSDNELKLLVNLGSGLVALTHPTILYPDGFWHNITVLRSGRHIALSVDGLSISSVISGSSIELNVYDSLYIGGIPETKPTLLGFIGCMRNIRIGSENIESPANATEAVNIAECF